VEDDIWVPALAIAAGRGENLSDIIRDALRAYIEQPHQGDK
jgi:Arc/MetJ-type ribon-helix-helix transcriptional regulator